MGVILTTLLRWGAHVATPAAVQKLLRIFQTLLQRKPFPCDAKPQSALQLGGLVFVGAKTAKKAALLGGSSNLGYVVS